MTNDEIMAMAREAGFGRVIKVNPHTGIKTVEAYAPDSLERFAKLVAAKEREACAQVCCQLAGMAATPDSAAYWMRMDCAAAIRARV